MDDGLRPPPAPPEAPAPAPCTPVRFYVYWLFALAAAVSAFASHIYVRQRVVDLGYQLGQERARRARMEHDRRDLELELASLEAPADLAQLARDVLGLDVPRDDQMLDVADVAHAASAAPAVPPVIVPAAPAAPAAVPATALPADAPLPGAPPAVARPASGAPDDAAQADAPPGHAATAVAPSRPAATVVEPPARHRRRHAAPGAAQAHGPGADGAAGAAAEAQP